MTLSQTQIQPPADWQAFERASEVLWTDILKDDGIHRFGRGGQEQFGLDLTGYRNGDPNQLVGIQCKCIDRNRPLDASTLRAEVRKVLASGFNIVEYFVTHTGPNDANLDRVAIELTQEQARLGRKLLVRVWGWETLQSRIANSDRAMRAFDPSVSLFAEATRDAVETNTQELRRLHIRFDAVVAQLSADPSATGTAAEAPLDREIDRYRRMIDEGSPRQALNLLETLWAELDQNSTGRIRFRVKANIGHCHVQLGEELHGADHLMAAAEHWPGNEKSIANKILGLLLYDRFQEAFDLAQTSIASFPDSEAIAAYLVQACRNRPLDGSPLDLLPEPLRSTELVVNCHIDHLRYHDKTLEWWELAHSCSARFPDNHHLKLSAADASIDRLTRKIRRWERLSEEEQAEALAASKVLEEQFDRIRRHDHPSRRDHLAYIANYVISLHTIGDLEKAAVVVGEALVIEQNDQNIVALAAQIGFEGNNDTLLDASFSKLDRSGNSLLIATQIAARRGDWLFLRGIELAEIQTLPSTDKEVVEALIRVAHAKGTDTTAALAIASDLVTHAKDNPRSSIVAAGLARELGDEALENQAFQNAISAADQEPHYSSRAMIANYATGKGLHGIVIRMLDDRVDTSHDNPDLRMLATAHAYAIPSRESGSKLFRELPPALRQSDNYLPLEGIYNYHAGDLEDAEKRFRAYLELRPRDCRAILLLGQTVGRQTGNYKPLTDFMLQLRLDELEGDPLDKIRVAQLLHQIGGTEEAIRYGYRVLSDSRDNPAVNLHYAGLILMSGESEILGNVASVSDGTWVETTGPNGELNSFLIEDGPDRPMERTYGLSHRYAQQTLGKSVGDEISVPHPGGEQSWRISRC